MERTVSICSALCLLVGFCNVAATPIAAQVVVMGPQTPVDMYESLCVLQGGVCRYVSECPSGQLTSIKGLCPVQQSQGVECCYTGRRGRREANNSCSGDNFCMPREDCGQLAERQGGCLGESVCCNKISDKPLCRLRGGACFDGRCGKAFRIQGIFEDCAEHETCCRLE
ncbi:uncharacterized protein [Anabrus simplex]|uniref:uncharacterized protein n=1 Tax=Anabrus simplex TaxID=316456 RepID=UPI0035A3673A